MNALHSVSEPFSVEIFLGLSGNLIFISKYVVLFFIMNTKYRGFFILNKPYLFCAQKIHERMLFMHF
jgi:hypothetical protein